MRAHFITQMLAVFGVLALIFGDCLPKESSDIGASRELPHFLFHHPRAIASGAIASGVALLIAASYIHFGLKLRPAPKRGPLGLSWIALIGIGITILVIIAAIFAGAFIR